MTTKTTAAVLGAAIILLTGYFLARQVEKWTDHLLKRMEFNKVAEAGGLTEAVEVTANATVLESTGLVRIEALMRDVSDRRGGRARARGVQEVAQQHQALRSRRVQRLAQPLERARGRTARNGYSEPAERRRLARMQVGHQQRALLGQVGRARGEQMQRRAADLDAKHRADAPPSADQALQRDVQVLGRAALEARARIALQPADHECRHGRGQRPGINGGRHRTGALGGQPQALAQLRLGLDALLDLVALGTVADVVPPRRLLLVSVTLG